MKCSYLETRKQCDFSELSKVHCSNQSIKLVTPETMQNTLTTPDHPASKPATQPSTKNPNLNIMHIKYEAQLLCPFDKGLHSADI